MRLMIKDGYNIEARSSEGFTPLHFAAIGRNFKTIRILINAGANLEAKDHYGRDFKYYLLCTEPVQGSC